jgi:hypothetical protein
MRDGAGRALTVDNRRCGFVRARAGPDLVAIKEELAAEGRGC